MAKQRNEGLYRDKTTQNWFCRFYDNTGKLKRLSTGKASQAEAEQAYQQIRAEHGLPPEEINPDQPRIAAIIAWYISVKDKTEHKGTQYAQAKILEYYENKTWDVLEQGDYNIDAYIRHRLKTVKPGTVNKEIGLLSAACNLIRKEQGVKIINHAAGKKQREPEYQYLFITEDQARGLIAAAQHNPKLVDFIRIGLGTGMRPGEIMRIKVTDIDLHSGFIKLPKTKGGRPHRAPINDMTLDGVSRRLAFIRTYQIETEWLFCHQNGKRTKSMYQVFRQACVKAGIPITDKEKGVMGFRPHDQRHTAASWLAQKGEPLRKIQELLNHSSVTQTERYSHLLPDAVKSTADKLPRL